MLAQAAAASERTAGRRTLRVHALVDSLGGGGAEMLIAELAAVAAGAGIDLSVGYLFDRAGSPGAPRLRARGIEPSLVGVDRLGPGAVRQVRRQIEAIKPDLVHTHLGYSDVVGGLAARSLRIPAVSTIHAMNWDASGREWVKEILMTQSRRRLFARVVMVSDVARDRYVAEGRDRPEHLVVVRNGIVGAPATGAGAAVRAELGIAPDELVVSIVAALRPEKEHGIAVEAMRAVRAVVPNARLLIAGDGPSRDAVHAAAATLGDGAIVAGFRDDVMAILDATDVLLHTPSYDALPTSLIEAMAASVPIVATDVGGIPEIAGRDEAAVLVPAPPRAAPIADALSGLLADPERRARLGAAGRERFEREFSAAGWAEKLRAVYDDVLS